MKRSLEGAVRCSLSGIAKRAIPLSALILCIALPPRLSAQTNWQYLPLNRIAAIKYSPDGSLVAVAGTGGVQLSIASTGLPFRGLPSLANPVSSVAFSADGQTLAVGGTSANNNGVLELWNISTGMLITTLNTTNTQGISAVAFSPDGKTLADAGIGADGTTIEFWTASFGTVTRSYGLIQEGFVRSIAFSPDSKTLAASGSGYSSGTFAGILELINIDAHLVSVSLNTKINYAVNSVTFSPDGKALAAGGQSFDFEASKASGTTELWNAATFNLISSTDSAASNGVNAVAFSPDGKSVGVGGYGPYTSKYYLTGVLEILQVSTGIRSASLPTTALGGVNALAFAPDGSSLIDGGVLQSPACAVQELWNLTTLELTGSHLFYSPILTSVAVSADGKTLASGGSSNSTGLVQLWDVKQGDLVSSPAADASCISSVAISPDGTKLCSGGWYFNNLTFVYSGVLDVRNAFSGARIAGFQTGANNSVSAVAFSPDGKMLAVGGAYYNSTSMTSGGALELWSVSSGKLIASLQTAANGNVLALTFSPDGQTLAVGGSTNGGGGTLGGSGGIIELWSVPNLRRTTTLSTAASIAVTALAFSPNGVTLAAGGNASDLSGGLSVGIAELWNISSGKLQSTLPLNSSTHAVNSVAFAPDGQVMFVGADAGIQAFGTTNYASLGSTDVPDVRSIAVTPDDSQVAFCTAHGLLSVFSNSLKTPVSLASLGISPTSVKGGVSATGTVVLTGRAPTGGATVSLSSSSSQAKVPTSITIAAGASTATFPVTTSIVASPKSAVITAKYGTTTATAKLTIGAPVIVSLVLNPSTLVGGAHSTGTITLSGPAPSSSDLVIKLSSSSTSSAVPASVTFAPGKTSAIFTITSVAVATNTTSTISASLNLATVSATLVIQAPSLVSLTLGANTVKGGSTTSAHVKISSPAPTGGLTIALASSQSAAVVPKSVTILAGATTANLSLSTSKVSSTTTTTITATLGTVKKSAQLTVIP